MRVMKDYVHWGSGGRADRHVSARNHEVDPFVSALRLIVGSLENAHVTVGIQPVVDRIPDTFILWV